MLVYVVGFAPANNNHSVGGFDWYPADERDAARLRMIARTNEGDGHSVTFVPLDVPNGLSHDEVTAWIDGNLELVEVSRPTTEPAPLVPRAATIEEAVEALRRHAFVERDEDETPRRTIIHSFAHGQGVALGADHDLDEAIAFARRADRIAWTEGVGGHDLAILADGRLLTFACPDPERTRPHVHA